MDKELLLLRSPTGSFFLFCRYNFKMISSLMRQGLCRVSIRLGKECFSKINWLNKSDGDFGTSSTISILDPKILASTLSDEVVQDKEEAEASTQLIRIEDSRYALTPSPDAPEVHEISDISYSNIVEIEEEI